MTASIVAKANAAGHGAQTTAAINSTGANFLLCAYMTANAPDTGLISDSKSNTWNWRTVYGGASWNVVIGYVYNATVGTGHTLSTSTSDYNVLMFYAFSGMVATSAVYDTENGATLSASSGNVTPAESGELLVSAVCASGSIAGITPDGGFVVEDLVNYAAGSNPGGCVAFDNTYDSTNAVACTWSAAVRAVVIEAFKVATPSGPDELTSAGITTGSPTLAASTIGQTHILSSTGITTSAASVGQSTLAQIHTLTASAITTGNPVLGAPSQIAAYEVGTVPVILAQAIKTIHADTLLTISAQPNKTIYA